MIRQGEMIGWAGVIEQVAKIMMHVHTASPFTLDPRSDPSRGHVTEQAERLFRNVPSTYPIPSIFQMYLFPKGALAFAP